MIWIAVVLLAAAALAPLALSVRRQSAARGRREAAIALHRAQLAELERDREEGRIGETEHASAVLEVQRRLLAASADEDGNLDRPTPRTPLLATLALVPVMALALYRIGGNPGLPSAPGPGAAARAGGEDDGAKALQEEQLINTLRTRLAQLDPKSDMARQGYVLLGNGEASRGRMAEAAQAWRTALEARFDPTLAAETAEALTEANGHLTDEAAGLFRRALAEAPPDAPWRKMVEKRLSGAN